MSDEPTTEEIALAWAIRTASPDFGDWEAFLAWIDGNAAHNDAYNRAALIVAEVAGAAPPRPATIVPLPTHPATPTVSAPRRWVLAASGLALAASVAGVLLVGRPVAPSAWKVVETPAGRARSISLADGSRIDLAGGSRLRFDPAHPRLARLDHGRAVFTVRHDAAAPYRVDAGAHRIVDAGTTFEVSRGAAAVRVEVAEGLVIVDPATAALRLEPGKAAELVPGRAARIEAVEPGSVGQWRRPSLSYTDASLERVAADLSVALGLPIVVDASARQRRVTATIAPATLAGKPEEAGELFGVRVVGDARGWTFYGR